jgi:hypothetical protein
MSLYAESVKSVPLEHLKAMPELVVLATQKGYFQNLPDAVKTPELCHEAVTRSGVELRWVPVPLKTEDLCLLAISHKDKHKCATLRDVPTHLRTPAICLKTVTNWGSYLSAVPSDLKTPELCRIALIRDDRNHCNLHDIPEAFRTREFCDIAYSRSPSCYKAIPKELQQFYKDPFPVGRFTEVHPDMPPLDALPLLHLVSKSEFEEEEGEDEKRH